MEECLWGEGFVILGTDGKIPKYLQLGIKHFLITPWPGFTNLLPALLNPNDDGRSGWSWVSNGPGELFLTPYDSNSHVISLYFVDWYGLVGPQKVEIFDQASSRLLRESAVTNYTNGVYLSWQYSGAIKIKISSPSRAFLSGLFFSTPSVATPQIFPNGGTLQENCAPIQLHTTTPDVEIRYTIDGSPPGRSSLLYQQPLQLGRSGTLRTKAFQKNGMGESFENSASFRVLQVPSSATFLSQDTQTGGNWAPAYGNGGYLIAGATQLLPPQSTVQKQGELQYTWRERTEDSRALLRSPLTSERTAACWYTTNEMTVSLSCLGPHPREIALYFMDWDNGARVQEITLSDPVTGAILDQRIIRNFQDGIYLNYKLQGPIKILIKKIEGANALLTGIFLSTPMPEPAIPARLGPMSISENEVHFTVEGSDSCLYRIESTTNLVDWEPVSLQPGSFNFDHPIGNEPFRYFRVIAIPME
ncbi:MAG: chitobiase/beta-hexosaminidase C-terminal domain-containing protein [Verrucomicrobiota bacterium]|nr:chitobiase/beta-hexosaminidase C-terminal domain-containing protein [Verrucomicrobiota bacterium]